MFSVHGYRITDDASLVHMSWKSFDNLLNHFLDYDDFFFLFFL